MEQVISEKQTLSKEPLFNSIYEDISAKFRIKVEVSKKQLEKARTEGQLRNKVLNNSEFISMVKSQKCKV